jgi:hypothetical protein
MKKGHQEPKQKGKMKNEKIQEKRKEPSLEAGAADQPPIQHCETAASSCVSTVQLGSGYPRVYLQPSYPLPQPSRCTPSA